MSNQISTFDFKSNPVRIELFNNEPYFCLTDVCLALNISNANSSRFKFNEAGVHKMYISFPSGKKEITFINEPNLYRIIFRSNKAEAVDFQNWVFEEVLPQIRKTGKYSLEQKQLALPEPPNKITLGLDDFYVLAKAVNYLNHSIPEWERLEDLFSDLESHKNYKTAFNLGTASNNLAQTAERIVMKHTSLLQKGSIRNEIEDWIFNNPRLAQKTTKTVNYLR